MRILYLFSGQRRKTSVAVILQKKAAEAGITVEIEEVDIAVRPADDLSVEKVQQYYLERIARGEYHVVIATPPCSTWSRVRGANCRGPPMVRSRGYPWGFPWVADRFKKDIELGNILIRFTIKVVAVLVDTKQWYVLLLAEHPEDLGTIYREEDGSRLEPASIWQLPDLRRWVDEDAGLGLFTLVFGQCCFGANYRKPTRLLTNIPSLKAWGPCGWPTFDDDGAYTGPLGYNCKCKPTTTLAKSKTDKDFRTSGTSAYPEAMDAGLAVAILAAAPPVLAKVGEKRKAACIEKTSAYEEQQDVDVEDVDGSEEVEIQEEKPREVQLVSLPSSSAVWRPGGKSGQWPTYGSLLQGHQAWRS